MINSESIESVTLSDPLHFTGSQFAVRIADLTVRVVSNDSRLALRLPPPMPLFLTPESGQDCVITASFSELSAAPAGRKLFDSGALWKLYGEDGKYVYRFTSPLFGPVPYKIAAFHPDFSAGEVFLHAPYFEKDPVYPLEYPLDELLLLNLLARGKGVELHSSGICDNNGDGYLFAGHSGAGKSTMSGLWTAQNGVDVLSDDRIILRRTSEGIRMHGTPWHGERRLSSPRSVALRGIYLLKQAKQNEIVPVSATHAAAALFAMSFPLFHSAPSLDFTLQFLTDVVQSVPCYEVRFVPESSIVDLVRSTGRSV